MRKSTTFPTALVAALSLVGCGDTGPQKLDENYMKDAAQIGQTRRRAYESAGGDYGKLTGAERRRYLDTFKGDETQARRYWEMMASPPPSSGPPRLGGR